MSLRARVAGWSIAVGTAILPLRLRGIPRVLSWLGPALFGRGVRCVPSVTGVEICADPGRYFDCMMIYGRFAPELVAFLRETLRRGDSVIDVGAQLGYVTSNMAALVGATGHVHSFEPDPNALSRLRRTVEANAHHWVRVFPLALGSESGSIEFHVSPTLGWSTAVKDTHHDDLEMVDVQCRRLDELVKAGEINQPVRFVKIDVEGFEFAVLDGMQELIRSDRPIIATEIAPTLLAPNGLTSVDVLRRIVTHDYRAYELRPATGIFGGMGFELAEVDPWEPRPDFCDIVCFPGEEAPRSERRGSHAERQARIPREGVSSPTPS